MEIPPDFDPVAPDVAEPPAPKHPYWADAPFEDIGESLQSKVQNYGAARLTSAMEARNSRAYQYYFGMDLSGIHATSQVIRGGEQGELAEMRVNHARSLVNTLLNLIIAPKIVWTPKATNVDYDSLRECDLASAILEYYWHDRRVSAHCVRALEESLVLTEGFVFQYWDPSAGDDYVPDPQTGQMVKTGDVCFENIPTWDVIRDPNKTSWDALDWVIVRQFRNKYTLAAQYPDYADLIHDAAEGEDVTSRPKQTGSAQEDTDDVAVYYFFHKQTPALPDGREVVFLNNKAVLADASLSYPELPLYRVSAGELFGTSFGYSPFMEILGMQELMDSLHTSIATNQSTLATQCISVQEGTQFNPEGIAGGMKVVYVPVGSNPPQALQLTATPGEVFSYLASLKKDQELLFGLNSVVRGEPQSGEQSGSALALLSSQALQQSSTIQGSYLRFVEQLGSGLLDIIKDRLAVERKIAIVGKSSQYLVTETDYSGKSLGRVKKVMVEIGNPMSQTASGRAEMAKELMANRLIKTPEQYIQVLATGRLEPLTKGVTDELMLIRGENEALARGEPMQALILDDHLMHAREHRSILANLQARANPAVVEAVLAHIAEHEQIYFSAPPTTLMMTGQQPPPMMGPPGAPPGGPPPPPGQKPSGNPTSGKNPNLPSMPVNKQSGERAPAPEGAPVKKAGPPPPLAQS